jgi:hypothetical protein
VWFIKLGIRPERIELGHPEPEKPKNGNNVWQTFQSLILGLNVPID